MNISYPDIYSTHQASSQRGASVILSTASPLGNNVTSFFEAVESDDSTNNSWYPHPRYVRLVDEIANSRRDAMFDLIGLGIELVKRAALPPDVTTLKRALFSLDDAYKQSNPGGEGGWSVTLVESNFAVCTSSTPFHSDFEFGILYGLADRFTKPDQVYKVTLSNPQSSRQAGGASCTYHVRWGKPAK